MLNVMLICLTMAPGQVSPGQVPPPASATPSVSATDDPMMTPAERRQADLRRLNEMRRQRHARGTAARNNAMQQVQNAATNRQAQAAQRRFQAEQAGALENLAGAAQRQAAIAEQQYRLNSQVAGAPQVYVPGQGMVPYANGIAAPWWWGAGQILPRSPVPINPNLNPLTPQPQPIPAIPAPTLDSTTPSGRKPTP